MTRGEATAREDEAGVANRDRDRHPGRNEATAPRRGEVKILPGDEVGASVADARIRRSRELVIEQHDRYLDHVRKLMAQALPRGPLGGGGHSSCVAYHRLVLVWMDLEMTGLEPERHVIVEIATLITDDHLAIVAEAHDLVHSASATELSEMDDVVRKMHGESGLLAGITASTLGVAEAGEQTLAFIKEHVKEASRVPLCGNSIGVDRRFLRRYLPAIDDYLSYRSVDVSTVKELCRRWSPGLYGNAPKKAGNHRALDDIRESVAELAYYRDTFFRLPGGGDVPPPEA